MDTGIDESQVMMRCALCNAVSHGPEAARNHAHKVHGIKGAVANALDAQTEKPMGFLVWWSLSSCQIPREVMADWARLHHFERCLPEAGPVALLRRAEHLVAAGHPEVLFRPLKAGGRNEATHSVLERAADGDARIDYTQRATISVDKSGSLSSDAPGNEWVTQVLWRYQQLRAVADTHDVSELVVRSVRELSGVPMRETGGVYFVDARHTKSVAALRDFVNALGGSSMSVFKVRDADEREQVSGAARSSLTQRVRALQADLEAFLAGDVKERGVASRVAKFNELRAEVEFYGDMLRDVAGDLTAQIDAAKEQMQHALDAQIAAE